MYNLFEKICRLRETVNLIEVVYIKKLWAFNTRQWDHEMLKRKAAYEKKNWYWEIPLLSFIAPPLRLHQIREHVKNTYFLKKLLSRVTDNCSSAWTLAPVWCENMHEYLSAVPKCEVFCEPNSRKTVSFEEQTMSMDKFTSIFFAK